MNDLKSYSTQDLPGQRQADADDNAIGFVALFRLLWRNKLRILAPAIVLSLIATFIVIRTSDTYTAEAQLILTRGNLDIIEFDAGERTTLSSGAVANALTILNSRNLAMQVVDRLDLVNNPLVNPLLLEAPEDETSLRDRLFFWLPSATGSVEEDTAAPDLEMLGRRYALDWLSSSIAILPLPGTNVILLTAVTVDPNLSAAVANAYAQNYLEYQLAFSQRESERAVEALSRRVGELRVRLEEDQQALQSYGAETQNLTEESLQGLVSHAGNVRARLDAARLEGEALDNALKDLDRLNTDDQLDARALFDASPTLLRFESEVLQSQASAQQLRASVIRLRAAIQDERARARQLETAFEESLSRLDERIEASNDFIVGFRQLEVELETTSQVYESSLARLKELIIQSGVRDAGAQILATAEVPLRHDLQGRRRIVIIAFILGILLGATYVLMREAANERIRRVGDLADATASRNIVQVPALKGAGLRRKDLPAILQGRSPFFEGIRALRQALLKTMSGRADSKVIGVFSSLPREGKSVVAIALARSFAMVGHSVLLIDADLRTSALRKTLEQKDKGPNLDDALAKGDLTLADLAVGQEKLGIDVIFGGQSAASPADLLASDRFAQLVAIARRHYDVVIFDTPPVLVVPDAGEIAPYVDQHVFVTQHDHTPRPAVRDAAAIMHDLGAYEMIAVLYNAPQAFGQQYGVNTRAFSRYRIN